MVSAIGPARRAVRIAPVAALVESREDEGESLRRRVSFGGALAVGGIAALVAGLAAPAIALVGLGAVAMFIGAGMLAPIVARPMSRPLGRPLAALLGTPGRLGRENSMRSPRRTAQTAAALMVGMALVSAIAVLGASLSKSATSQPRQRRHRRLHHHRSRFRVQHLGARGRLPDPGRGDGHDRVPGPVRAPGLTVEPGRRDRGRPVADGPSGHHRRERRSRPWPPASC